MLTEKTSTGEWCLKGLDWDDLSIGKTITPKIWEKLYGALFKLARYEDIGFEPHDVSYMAERTQWIPIEENAPDPGEYVLVSFYDFPNVDIGRYEEIDGGGIFYPGDDDRSYASRGFIVNAWMPLPERYKE